MTAPRYRTAPVHELPGFAVEAGYEALAAAIHRRIQDVGPGTLVVIDGFAGTRWSPFIDALRASLERVGVAAQWCTTAGCFLPDRRIEEILASTLTADPVFGRLFRGHIEELWDPKRAEALRQELLVRADPTIVYGFGASLLATSDLLIYLEVPKDRGQQLAAHGLVPNIGADSAASAHTAYKRLYFVDWPMLNRVKRALLPRLDLFVDLSEVDTPLSTHGDTFRAALHALARQPFRVKPWFAPGPWGGQWMKEQFGLPPEQPNYAWSFELIAPENGILLGDGEQALECAFDDLLWQEADTVLGEAVAARYGSYFPIRFDYLDTMGGGNLSCQVHPRLDYMRDEFGEPITQDESYYIVACEPGARVFQGLRDDVDPAELEADATAARDRSIPFEIERHVASKPSRTHELYLIPSGTVHCSGSGNLVLEISATPYIYTFKIYDYLRADMQGKRRHVHLDRAFANIDPTRTASWVGERLSTWPEMLREGPGWVEYRLGHSDLLFFAIHRLEFDTEIDDRTEGRFVALNLVEGERCQILTEGNAPVELRFAESVVIPASVGNYILRNIGAVPCKAVKAFVK